VKGGNKVPRQIKVGHVIAEGVLEYHNLLGCCFLINDMVLRAAW
jgi:hypothetical protein